MSTYEEVARRLYHPAHQSDDDLRKSKELIYGVEKFLHKPVADALAADASTLHQAYLPQGLDLSDSDSFIRLLPQGALTADNTNYATINVSYDDGAGGSDTTVAEVTTEITGTGNWVAGTGIVFAAAAFTNKQIPAGSTLILKITKAGTGVVVPIMDIQLYGKAV